MSGRRVCKHPLTILNSRGLDEENPPVCRLQSEDVRLLGVVGRTLSQGVVHADDLLSNLLITPVVHLTHTHTHRQGAWLRTFRLHTGLKLVSCSNSALTFCK